MTPRFLRFAGEFKTRSWPAAGPWPARVVGRRRRFRCFRPFLLVVFPQVGRTLLLVPRSILPPGTQRVFPSFKVDLSVVARTSLEAINGQNVTKFRLWVTFYKIRFLKSSIFISRFISIMTNLPQKFKNIYLMKLLVVTYIFFNSKYSTKSPNA